MQSGKPGARAHIPLSFLLYRQGGVKEKKVGKMDGVKGVGNGMGTAM